MSPADRLPPLLTPDTALFIDMDGTLLDIAPRHDLVVVPPDLPPLVARLETLLDGALAVVSGRPLGDILSFLPLNHLCCAAEHGVRLRLPDGTVREQAKPLTHRAGWIAAIREALPQWPGALIEEKSIGFVVHYRLAPPESGPAIRALLDGLVAEAPEEAEILTALMAYEIRPVGVGKGAAVRTIMQLPPFIGRKPVFIGDDVTDEEGMAACADLGGYGLHVERDFTGGPTAVRAWLADCAHRLASLTPAEKR